MMEYPKNYSVSRTKLHLFFAFTTLLFIAIVVLVAGLRINWFVSAQEEQLLKETDLTVNEYNVRPVNADAVGLTDKPTTTPQVIEDESAEPELTPTPTLVPTPAAEQVTVTINNADSQITPQNQQFNTLTVNDSRGNTTSVDLNQECSVTAAKVSHDNKLVAFICEQVLAESQEDGLFISNLFLYNITTGETEKLTAESWNSQTINCQQKPDSANIYYLKPALEWYRNDSKLLFARSELNVCENSNKNISVSELTLADKSISITYRTKITINDNLLDLNYSSSYQSAYLFIEAGGKIEVSKIPL